MDDAVVKPIKELVKIAVAPIREELSVIHEQVVKNTVQLNEHSEILDKHSEILDKHSVILNHHSKILDQHTKVLDQHSNKLDSLSVDMIFTRHTTEATLELLRLIAEKLGIKLPEKIV